MSRSKFKVTHGLAQVVTTAEPVFVNAVEDGVASITRPVVTPDGIVHLEEKFPLEQLETRYEEAKRKIELEEYVVSLRKEAEARVFALPEAMKSALEAAKAKRLTIEGTK